MALAIDSSSPAFVSSNSAQSSLTTASFTPPAGSMIWAFAAWDQDSSGSLSFSSTGGPTMTTLINQHSQNGSVAIGYGLVSASQAMTITATSSGGHFEGCSLKVIVFTGAETDPGGAFRGIGRATWNPYCPITASANNSIVIAVAAGYSGTASRTAATTNDFSPGPYSSTMLNQHMVGGRYQGGFARVDGTTTAGRIYSLYFQGSPETGNIAAVEIRENATFNDYVFDPFQDGRVQSVSTVYSSARTGFTFGTSTSETFTRIGEGLFGSDYTEYENFWDFNTSGIEGDIESVNLEFHFGSNASDTDFDIEVRGYDFGTSITSADWINGANLGNYTLLATRNTQYQELAVSQMERATIPEVGTAFRTYINKTGNTRFMTSSDRLRVGTAPTGLAYVQVYTIDSGTNLAPKLKVTTRAVSLPVVTAELWENGSFKSSIGNSVISAEGIVEFTWDASTLTALSGANVELRLSSDNPVDIDAVQWVAYRQLGAALPSATGESWGLVLI